MSEKIRTFIAIELSEEIKKELAELQDKLKTANARIRWVRPENIHLTLKFLGNVEIEKLEEIKKTLLRAAGDTERFSLSLGLPGAFPNAKSPRVIWVGLSEGEDGARKLAQGLESLLQNIGFEKEKRPYQTHLTLGRVKAKPPAGFKNLLDGISLSSRNEMIVESITLFKSTLTPQGPIYEVLAHAPLK